MAEKKPESLDTGGPVPAWLQRYAEMAREAVARGDEPAMTVEQVAQAAGVQASPIVGYEVDSALPKGVSPRARSGGRVVYEVRHRGRAVGTYSTVEEAREAKAEAEKRT